VDARFKPGKVNYESDSSPTNIAIEAKVFWSFFSKKDCLYQPPLSLTQHQLRGRLAVAIQGDTANSRRAALDRHTAKEPLAMTKTPCRLALLP
jgi:hypothetical protein